MFQLGIGDKKLGVTALFHSVKKKAGVELETLFRVLHYCFFENPAQMAPQAFDLIRLKRC